MAVKRYFIKSPTPDKEDRELYEYDQWGRVYTDSDRAIAIVMYRSNGNNLAITSRQLGIPFLTIQGWLKGKRKIYQKARHMADQLSEELVLKLEKVAVKIVGGIEDKIPKANVRDLAFALDVVVSKMRLLRGESTSAPGIPESEKLEKVARLIEMAKSRGLAHSESAMSLMSIKDDAVEEHRVKVLGIDGYGNPLPSKNGSN